MKKYFLKQSFIAEMRRQGTDRKTAKILGCHPSALSLFFNGHRSPSKDFIIKICTRLSLFPSEFLTVKKETNQ